MSIETIGSILGQSYASNNAVTSSEGSKDNIGRDEFLTMFVAQLRNQDPLNPLDATEFTAQLAQYSSLEQLLNINGNLESLNASQEQDHRLQALDFLGKEVVADGDMLFLEPSQMSEGRFSLTTKADCTALILDSNGYPVKSIPLGVLESGQHQFQWDGLDASGNKMDRGIYSFEITALTEDGTILPVTTQITGKVTGVNLETESPILFLGDIPLYLSQVQEIKAPESVSP
jgi:flagellar basal-body rod modification protein FlgD